MRIRIRARADIEAGRWMTDTYTAGNLCFSPVAKPISLVLCQSVDGEVDGFHWALNPKKVQFEAFPSN